MDKSKICVPPLHIKLGLIKISSNEYGERFHQDISQIEKRYSGK